MIISCAPSFAGYAPTNHENSNLLKPDATLCYCAIGIYRRFVVSVFSRSQVQYLEYSRSHNFYVRDKLMQPLAARAVKEMPNDYPVHVASKIDSIPPL